jgi:hypothetical protein
MRFALGGGSARRTAVRMSAVSPRRRSIALVRNLIIIVEPIGVSELLQCLPSCSDRLIGCHT